MIANRQNVDSVANYIMERKRKALLIAGTIVKSQAFALAKPGKYPAGSGKVGGALRQSIYLIVDGDSAKIGSNLVYAAMQEFGGVVTPMKAKALTIPMAPEAVGKRASDFEGLFVLKLDNGAYLVRVENDRLKFYFILLKSVTIPKRPFLRPALEIKRQEVIKILQDG